MGGSLEQSTSDKLHPNDPDWIWQAEPARGLSAVGFRPIVNLPLIGERESP
jgi:hypothetical protein